MKKTLVLLAGLLFMSVACTESATGPDSQIELVSPSGKELAASEADLFQMIFEEGQEQRADIVFEKVEYADKAGKTMALIHYKRLSDGHKDQAVVLL